MNKKVTINDIARLSGVSKTTISYFLNGRYENMSETTEKRIREVIENLGYRPSNVARSLKSRKSKVIGVVIHEFANQVSLLTRGICSTCFKYGYSPIIFNSYEDGEIEKKNIQSCFDNQVDGIILSPSTVDFEYYNSIPEKGIPVVLVNRFSEQWKYDAVYINHYTLVKKALRHIWDNGIHRIALVEGKYNPISTKSMRKQAFLDFVREKNAESTTDIFTLVGQPSSEDLAEIIKCRLEKYLRDSCMSDMAIFAIDNNMLYWVISAIRKMSPDERGHLVVYGYDAWDWGALVMPSINTVTQPFEAAGKNAADILVKRIEKELSDGPEVICLEGQLILRDPDDAIKTE